MATTIDELRVLITAQNKQFQAAMRDVSKQLGSLDDDVKRADRGISRSLNAIGNVAKRSLQVTTVGAIAAITASIPAAVRRVDTLNNSARVFENMGFKTKDAEEAMEALNDSILGLPTPLDSAVRGMTALAATYSDVKLGQEVFSALNNAILGFGGSAAQVDNAIMQLSQLPMDGPLDAQTWNSLRNSGLTPVLVAMAEESGTSVSKMKAAFGDGELKVQDFIDRLIKMNKEGGGSLKSLQQIAKDSTKGISTSFANLKTAIARSVANIITELGPENFSGAINNMAGVVNDIGKRIVKEIPNIRKSVRDAMAKVFEFRDLIASGDLDGAGRQLGTAIGNGIAEAIKLMRIGMDTIKNWFGSINWGEVGMAVGVGGIAFIAGLVTGLFSTEALMQFVGFIADNWVEVLLLVATIAFSPARLLGPFGKLFSNIIGKIPFGQYFTSAFGKIVTSIRGFTEPIRTAFHGAFVAPITTATSGTVTAIKSIISAVKDIIMQPFRLAVAYVADAIRSIPPVAGAVVNAIKAYFAPMVAWFRVTFQAVLDTVVGVFSRFAQPASAAWSAIRGTFSGTAGWFKKIFQAAWDSITSIFKNLASWFGKIDLAGAGRKIVDSLIGGIKSKVGDAKQAASDVAGAIRDFFPFSPAKEGPFSGLGYTTHSGKALMRDFADSISKEEGYVNRAISSAFNGVGINFAMPSLDDPTLDIGGGDMLANIDSQPVHITVMVGDDKLVDKVITGINNKSFLANNLVIDA